MIDEQKLYELLKDFDPAVGERMEKHFKDGAYHFDLGNSKYTYFEGASVYTVIPHFAEKGSEGIVILSILVDTFFSRITQTMLPTPNYHSTACVLA